MVHHRVWLPRLELQLISSTCLSGLNRRGVKKLKKQGSHMIILLVYLIQNPVLSNLFGVLVS